MCLNASYGTHILSWRLLAPVIISALVASFQSHRHLPFGSKDPQGPWLFFAHAGIELFFFYKQFVFLQQEVLFPGCVMVRERRKVKQHFLGDSPQRAFDLQGKLSHKVATCALVPSVISSTPQGPEKAENWDLCPFACSLSY